MLAWMEEETVGFTWGYLVSKTEMRKIASVASLDFLFDENKQIFHVDELGVGSPFRGRKCGAMLSWGLIVQVRKDKRTSIILLRTLTDNILMYISGLALLDLAFYWEK